MTALQDTTLGSWDSFNEEFLGESNDFVFNQRKDYAWFNWGSGQLGLVDANGKTIAKATLDGLYIPYTGAPNNLVQVLDKLLQKGLAKINRVRHSNNEIKEYITLKDDSYRMFPLITGVMDLKALVPLQCYRPYIYDNDGNKKPGPYPDESLNIGIATGKRTTYPKDGYKPGMTVDTLNFVSVLFVFDILWDHGYVDANGVPIPLKIDLKFPAGDEFYRNVLVKHATLVDRARNMFPAFKNLRPWQLGLYMHHDTALYTRGSQPGKTREVYEVVAQFPEVAFEDYYKQMHVGNVNGKYDVERVKTLSQLIYEDHVVNGRTVKLPTGPAIVWARDVTHWNIEHQRKVNPVSDKYPFGPQKSGKMKPVSDHLKAYLTQQERSTDTNVGDVPTDSGDPTVQKLKRYKEVFTGYSRDDLMPVIEQALEKVQAGTMSQLQVSALFTELEKEQQQESALADLSTPDNPF